MTWRDTIEYWAMRVAPFAAAAAFLAVAVALIVYAPPRTAAAVLGILAGTVLGYNLMTGARLGVQIAVQWAAIGVTADAAYARLNDVAPVTVAGMLIKAVDACVKLSEPLIKGVGLAGANPRVKVDAVAPDFVWALILSLIVTMAIVFPYLRRK